MKTKFPSIALAVLGLIAIAVGLSSCGKPAGKLCDFGDHTEGYYQYRITSPAAYSVGVRATIIANPNTALSRDWSPSTRVVTERDSLAQNCGNSVNAEFVIESGAQFLPLTIEMQDKDGNVIQLQVINSIGTPVVFAN